MEYTYARIYGDDVKRIYNTLHSRAVFDNPFCTKLQYYHTHAI